MRKNMISMLHSWALAHHRIEVSTIEEFLNMCSLYIPQEFPLYILCIRVVPLCAFFLIFTLLIKKKVC